MSREMRVFVFLVVYLFSVNGADGALTIKPDNAVLVRGSVAPLNCATDGATPTWTYASYMNPAEEEATDATDAECKSVADIVDTNHPDAATCDLLVKDTIGRSTVKYTCTEGDAKGSGLVMFLESPMKCGIEEEQYSCTIENSAYINTAPMVEPYLTFILTWKDEGGNVIGSKDADLATPGTNVRAPIADAATRDSPHVCSAEFRMVGALGTEFSPIVNIIPDGKLECNYPDTAETEQAAKEAAAMDGAGIKTSNAKLERDGIEAIAMLMSLMAAFLVH